MKPHVIFHPDSGLEVEHSFYWYEEQAEGLGDEFLDELDAAYVAISSLPDSWPYFEQPFRRFMLIRFPFSVIYKVLNEQILVIAVMHHSRKPGYWINRK